MTRSQAKKIAETITNSELAQMFENARTGIKNWETVSRVNKGMTKGTAWNILAKRFDPDALHHMLAKTNMVREFGDFLPDHLKPASKAKRPQPAPVHQSPDFT